MDTRSEIYPVGGLKSSVFLAFGLFYTVLAALRARNPAKNVGNGLNSAPPPGPQPAQSRVAGVRGQTLIALAACEISRWPIDR